MDLNSICTCENYLPGRFITVLGCHIPGNDSPRDTSLIEDFQIFLFLEILKNVQWWPPSFQVSLKSPFL